MRALNLTPTFNCVSSPTLLVSQTPSSWRLTELKVVFQVVSVHRETSADAFSQKRTSSNIGGYAVTALLFISDYMRVKGIFMRHSLKHSKCL